LIELEMLLTVKHYQPSYFYMTFYRTALLRRFIEIFEPKKTLLKLEVLTI